ncbi:hypothetical protein RE6C_03987 [Rhodopirellula europaea 6C]|uniref:Uncharacterized protein n=1 Tax=Rhodopirellula europaea 6C TaxID=1263867 RepID=M2A5A0_9BACT|nr:hypothetical protein RE6C_03987 [Rhodopirellula europaea 6C]
MILFELSRWATRCAGTCFACVVANDLRVFTAFFEPEAERVLLNVAMSRSTHFQFFALTADDWPLSILL